MTHQRAGDHAEELLHGRPALNRRRLQAGLFHPVVDCHAELRHLKEGRRRHALGRYVLVDIRQLGLDDRGVVSQLAHASEQLEKVKRLDADTGLFEEFLTIPNRVECRWAERPERQSAGCRSPRTIRHVVAKPSKSSKKL